MNTVERLRALTADQRSALLERLEPSRDAGDKSLVAFVVFRDGAQASADELRRFCATQLPEFMVPSSFVPLDQLPLHPNGKVNRQALSALQPQANPRAATPSNTASETESRLCKLWAEILRVETVGVNDNFFQLGGHSLLALQLMARVREAFKADLPIKTLFASPTVAGLAKAVEQRLASGSAPIRRVPRPNNGAASPVTS